VLFIPHNTEKQYVMQRQKKHDYEQFFTNLKFLGKTENLWVKIALVFLSALKIPEKWFRVKLCVEKDHTNKLIPQHSVNLD